MTGVSASVMWCGGNHRRSRASRRTWRCGPANSSAQSADSDASVYISPMGVTIVARCRRTGFAGSTGRPSRGRLDEVADDGALQLDELLDAVVGEIEEGQQRVTPERHRFRRPLHFDEPPVTCLDNVH